MTLAGTTRRSPIGTAVLAVGAFLILALATVGTAYAQCSVPNCTTCVQEPTCTGCAGGYSLNVGANTCNDVNECATNGGGCAVGTATCTNTPGSRSCTCNAGYAGPGTICNDVNECATGAACGVGTCINTAGAFGCDCPSGVTGDDCGVNGYVPPDRATAKCANAIASKIGSYVKCVLQCRTRKASKELAGKSYDEQACTSACRAAFDGKVAQLKTRGLCPACLDETAQNLLAEDARLYSMDVKGHGYCQGTEPLAP